MNISGIYDVEKIPIFHFSSCQRPTSMTRESKTKLFSLSAGFRLRITVLLEFLLIYYHYILY